MTMDKAELLQLLKDPEVLRVLHTVSDLDRGWNTQHHTLGKGTNQSSPGNHKHDGANSTKLFSTGTINITTDASGVFTFNHNLGVVPTIVVLVNQGGPTQYRITARTATTATFIVRNQTGTAVVASTALTFDFLAVI